MSSCISPIIFFVWFIITVAGHTSGTLRFVESKVVSNSFCKKFYHSRIRDTNVCISGAWGKGPCFVSDPNASLGCKEPRWVH